MSKEERESKAANQLFGLLPDDQTKEIRDLWEEFDKMKSPDSQFAAAIDRLQPFIINYLTEGHTWKLGNVTSDKVYRRMDMVRQSIPDLWEFVEDIIQDSISKGYLQK